MASTHEISVFSALTDAYGNPDNSYMDDLPKEATQPEKPKMRVIGLSQSVAESFINDPDSRVELVGSNIVKDPTRHDRVLQVCRGEVVEVSAASLGIAVSAVVSI